MQSCLAFAKIRKVKVNFNLLEATEATYLMNYLTVDDVDK